MSLDAATRLARNTQAILGKQLVAAILHGSLVLDGFVPGQSDVDVLLVVTGRLSEGDAVALQDAAVGLGSQVDLRVITEEVAAAPTASPVLEFAIDVHGGRVHVDSNVPERDFVVELSLARAHDPALVAVREALAGRIPARAELGALLGRVRDELPRLSSRSSRAPH